MSSEELPQEAPETLEAIVAVSRADVPRTLAEGLKLAKDWGLTVDGDCISGREAENRAKYGASSPKHRYCYEPRGITVEDLAKDWGLDKSLVRAWVTAGKWDKIRSDHLETVPLWLGGRLATEDLATIKDRYIRQSLGDALEIQRVTMERIHARTEQTPGKDSVFTLDKTSKEHLNDVLAYDTADKMARTALGLPTKYSATMTQTTTEKRKVTASVVQAPQRGGSSRALPESSTITTTTTETLEAG